MASLVIPRHPSFRSRGLYAISASIPQMAGPAGACLEIECSVAEAGGVF